MKRSVVGVMAAVGVMGCIASAPAEVMSYSPASFMPQESASVYVSGGAWLGSGPDATLVMYAPVQIPNGAKITKLKLTYTDRSSQDMSLSLRRSVNATPTSIATVQGAGSAVGTRTAESGALSEVVNHDANIYYLELLIPARNTGEAFFLSAVITYDPPPAAASCAGDVNGDRRVDTADLSVLLARFGAVCAP